MHASNHLLHDVPTKPAKDRLLAAATRVFARDGLDGATTREIAQEAGVNEVTLFRLFGSKKKLLAEVVAQSFSEQATVAAVIPTTNNLRNDLTAWVKEYERQLVDNIAMIRTMIGDLQRHREHEVQVLRGIFQTMRSQMIERVKLAQADGVVRKGVNAAIAVDQLMAMIFTCVLKTKKSNHAVLEYPVEDYIAASLDLVVGGLTKNAKS